MVSKPTIKKMEPHQKPSKAQLVEKFITTIDDHIKLCSPEGFFWGTHPKKCEFEINIDTPTTKEDAQEIRNLFEKSYAGTYPFKEMLDTHYLMKTFANPNWIYRVFRINSPEQEDYKRIIGSWIWNMDYKNKVGYNRGFNLLPKYQKKIPILELTYKTYRKLMISMRGKIDKWYNESRTAHTISQFLSQGGGAHSHAIFINKDYFMGKKESDVMMCAYFDDVVEKKRRVPHSILPDIEKIHRYSLGLHKIDEFVPIKDVKIKINPFRVQELMNTIEFSWFQDKYGYIRFKFTETKTNSYLMGFHTQSVKNIEKIYYRASDPDITQALYYLLREYAIINKVEYIEWMVPEYDQILQKILMQGMKLQGYIPCWSKCTIEEDKYHDVVIFGWSDKDLNRERIQLTKEGTILLNILNNCDQNLHDSQTTYFEFIPADLLVPVSPI